MTPEQKKIFESLGTESNTETKELSINDRVLIVDALNMFIRAFTVIQHINPSGNHIGGLTGFLRSLSVIVNLIRPTRMIIVFDGKGSSTNKKYIYPEYKANRGIRRITNWDMFDNQQEESEAITNQLVRLIDYLKCLPVDLIQVDKIEADDVIGYLANQLEGKVTIVSSDRDYLQLVNERIDIYSPIKKKFYNTSNVIQEYDCSPVNFLVQKVIIGDSGDNVPGVGGIKQKTLAKLFPELKDDYQITLEEVIDRAKKEKGKHYENIRNFEHQLKINKLLMDLSNPNIPDDSKVIIHDVLDNPKKQFEPKEFMRLYEEDNLGSSISNLQFWLHNAFLQLSKYK
jgi:DNA polymerase-1